MNTTGTSDGNRLHPTNQAITEIAIGFETEMKDDVFTGEQVGKILRGIAQGSEEKMAEVKVLYQEAIRESNKQMLIDELNRPPIRRTKD